jgi:hypothetical protein
MRAKTPELAPTAASFTPARKPQKGGFSFKIRNLVVDDRFFGTAPSSE